MIWQAFVRGAVVILVAALATVVLRHRPAAIRHHIWASALFIQLALLALLPVMPALPLPVSADIPRILGLPAEIETTTPSPATATDARVASPAASTEVTRTRTRAPAPASWRTILFGVWALGAGLIFLRYLLGTLMMARLARRGRRVEEGQWLTLAQRVARELSVTRPVTLLWGDKLAVPVTWGILYPMILLPGAAEGWSEERRRFVLVHEMAHVRRFDALTQLVAQVTLAVFWFSPFVWLCEWRLRVEREHACDDVVLHYGTEPTLYADELLQMARSLVTRNAARPAFAALAMARRSELEGRMLAILDSTRSRSASGVGSTLLFVALSLLIAAPLAALDLTARPAERAAAPLRAASAKGTPAAAAAAATVPWSDCSFRQVATSVHSIIDQRRRVDMRIKIERESGCSWLVADGVLTFREDDQGVQTMQPGASVVVREVTHAGEGEARLTAAADGAVTTTFTLNGAIADPAEAAAWIARVLPPLLREAGEDPDRRVRSLLSAYGLHGTLERIGSIASSARTKHYEALLRAREWSTEEFGEIGRSQSRASKD